MLNVLLELSFPAGRVEDRLVAHIGLTSAALDQGVIGAFLQDRFLKVLALRQLVGPFPWSVSSTLGSAGKLEL
jgi:hypothetical protein